MEESKQTSKYNDNQWLIDRINWLLIQCNNLSVNGDYVNWRWKLDVIWRELTGVIEKFKTKKERWESRKKVLDFAIKVSFREGDRGKIYKALSEKERFLRGLKEEAGIGIKWQDADDDDVFE